MSTHKGIKEGAMRKGGINGAPTQKRPPLPPRPRGQEKWNFIEDGQPERSGWYYLAYITSDGDKEVRRCWWTSVKWFSRYDFDLVACGYQLIAWQHIPETPDFPCLNANQNGRRRQNRK